MICQPHLQVFFRPEEIIVASAASPEDDDFRRRDMHNSPPLDDRMDVFRAMDARIEDLDALIGVITADQQEKIDRSGHIEALAIFELHGMEREAEWSRPLLPVHYDGIGDRIAISPPIQQADVAQHIQPVCYV